jgi:hypothetical protein
MGTIQADIRHDADDDFFYTYPKDERIDSEEYNALAQIAFWQLEIIISDWDLEDGSNEIRRNRTIRKKMKNVSKYLRKVKSMTALRLADDMDKFNGKGTDYR